MDELFPDSYRIFRLRHNLIDFYHIINTGMECKFTEYLLTGTCNFMRLYENGNAKLLNN